MDPYEEWEEAAYEAHVEELRGPSPKIVEFLIAAASLEEACKRLLVDYFVGELEDDHRSRQLYEIWLSRRTLGGVKEDLKTLSKVMPEEEPRNENLRSALATVEGPIRLRNQMAHSLGGWPENNDISIGDEPVDIGQIEEATITMWEVASYFRLDA